MALTVAYLISTLADCGPVNVLWGIVRHLDPNRYRPVIVTLSQEPERSSIRRFQDGGVQIIQLNISRIKSLLAGRRRFREAIASADACLIHCHGIRATLLAARERARCPLLATLHCDLEEDYRLAYGLLLGTTMAGLEYRALSKYPLVAAVSDGVAQAASRRGVESCVISNGIDLDTYSPPRDRLEMSRARENLGWPTDSAIVLHTGMLSARKRPIEIIRGFLAAHSTSNNLMVFAGDGPLKEDCKRAANNSSRILFLGRRTDVPRLLKAADVLISNSASEGLPLALLEGCASGLLVLATDIPPHRAIQKIFPEQVMLFRDRPRELLESALIRLAEKGYIRAVPPKETLEAISDRRMSQSYQAAYKHLLEGCRNCFPAIG